MLADEIEFWQIVVLCPSTMASLSGVGVCHCHQAEPALAQRENATYSKSVDFFLDVMENNWEGHVTHTTPSLSHQRWLNAN